MGGGRRPITRLPGGARRTDLLELFFDLAAISTLVLTSNKMATEQSWTAIAQALLGLSTLYAVWVTTTSFTDLYSPQARAVQLVILGIMFGGMLMSAALPTAFDNHGLVFGGTWAGINWGRALVVIPSLRGRPEQQRSKRVLVLGFGATIVLLGVAAVEFVRRQRPDGPAAPDEGERPPCRPEDRT